MKSNTENNRQLQRGKKDIYACHRHKNKNYHCKKEFLKILLIIAL